MNDITQNLILELRRGTLVLSVLSQLDEPQYGYALQQTLAGQGVDIEQGTLYPLLRRLESQGLLDSEWIVQGSRPRRYYELNPRGRDTLRILTREWHSLCAALKDLLGKELEDGSKSV